MSTQLFIVLVTILVLLLIILAPKNILRFIGNNLVKITIGVLLLFFLNVFGGNFGLHVPINVFTILVSSFLGIFGVISLAIMAVFFI